MTPSLAAVAAVHVRRCASCGFEGFKSGMRWDPEREAWFCAGECRGRPVRRWWQF